MSFAFFGTPSVARDTLALLYERGQMPAVVITNPDAPRGRGHVLTPSEIKQWALEHRIPVLSPAQLDTDAVKEIAAYRCEYAVVVAYGKILPQPLIDAFPNGIYNVHYSILPKYRGASPVEAALLADDTETGVTVQRLAAKLDAGDIVAQRFEPILPTDTTRALRERLIAHGAELLIEVMPDIEAGTVAATPQNHADATYAPKITKEDGRIDLSAPARENWNKYRAYVEWPGTYFFTERNGKRLRVKIADAVLTPAGEFKILRVIPEGKNEVDYEVFRRA